MAQQYATGAVHVYLRPNNGTLFYFGTCESMPQDSRKREYETLMNDMSGSKVPLDVAFEGEDAQISLVMTRITQSVTEGLLAVPTSVPAAGNNQALAGYSMFDVGSLSSIEGLTWECWLVYSFGAALGNKPAYTAAPSGTLRPGRHYLQCVLWAPQAEEAGSRIFKQHFLLYAWPKFTPANRRFTLYDYTMPAGALGLIT